MTSTELTVGAGEFAQLTGVSRERLRTWERRHGFPKPHRENHGPRRYAMADATKVIAIRRLIEQNTPVATAISKVNSEADRFPSELEFASICEHSPTPTLVLSGPSPLRIAYLNAAARSLTQSPMLGSKLDERFTDEQLHSLQHAFAATDPQRAVRPRWDEPSGEGLEVVTVPLTSEQEIPLIAVFDLQTKDEQEVNVLLDSAESQKRSLVREKQKLCYQLETCLLVSNQLKTLSSLKAIDQTTRLLVERLEASDAALAPYIAGQLVLGRSARGLLGGVMLTVTEYSDLQEILYKGKTGWLSSETAAAFETPGNHHLLASAVVCAAEPMGLLITVFEHQDDFKETLSQVIGIVSGDLGLAMMQERLLDAKFPTALTFDSNL